MLEAAWGPYYVAARALPFRVVFFRLDSTGSAGEIQTSGQQGLTCSCQHESLQC